MIAACPACDAAPLAAEIAADAQVEQGTKSVTLSVPSLHCAGCIRTVEQALESLPGVQEARVNLSLRRVSANSQQDPEVLIAALADAGYEAFALDSTLLDRGTDPAGQDLMLRLGVAGFAMMNVMLLSVAVWSGASEATRDLFHLISAAIALPAAIYSAQPFFRNAKSALRVGRLNMDVPISLAIILAGGMSLYEALNGGAHAYFDAALSLTFFLLIGRVLEHRSRSAARSAAKELAALEVHTAERRRGNTQQTVPIADLAVGDVVRVASGTRVPVDGALLSPTAFTDRSFLTGESAAATSTCGQVLRAGEINLGAPVDLRAQAVGEDTSLRQLARLVETAEHARNRYTSLADRAARVYAPVVHILAALTFVGWLVATGDARDAINKAIAVLIITCPCALGLAVPAVSTAAIGRLYGLGFLVKSGTALERLAEVETVLLDKTGTLTKPGFRFDLATLSPENLAVTKALAQASSHPLCKALARHLDGVEPATLQHLTETPGSGVSGQYQGQTVRLGRASWADALGQSSASATGLTLAMPGETIPLPHSETEVAGARDLPSALADLGLSVEMISGDSAEKTGAMASHLGIHRWTASMTPEEKHRYVSQQMARGKNTCMVGDGINDTAALAAAHASVAPGTALDAARNAADVVLMRDSLGGLATLFAVARLAVRLSRQNFAIAVVYNIVAVPIAVAGLATPMVAALAMSTSSLSVLVNALRVRWQS